MSIFGNNKDKEQVGLKIIIVGCGKVGSNLVSQLIAEGHEITVIDKLSSRIQEITNLYDVMGIVGNGASYTFQKEAGLDETDLLVAVTGSDELNMLCCTIAQQSVNCSTIARVRTSDYSQEIGYLRDKLGIAMIVNPELDAATEAANILGMPAAVEVNPFAKGIAELVRFKVDEESVLNGRSLMELGSKNTESILVGAIERDGDGYIPAGQFRILAGDTVSVIGTRRSVAKFMEYAGLRNHTVRNAIIIGGGQSAYYLATQLINMNIAVKIIERDMARCEELSILLPKAVIIHADGTDEEVLREEGIVNAEAFIPLTGIDEQNIILTLYAKKICKGKVITKITRIGFPEIISNLDLGSVLYPQKITAEAITGYVRAMHNSRGCSNIETMYHLLNHSAEAVEFRVDEDNAATNIPLKDLTLKKNYLVACIVRNGMTIIPGGSDYIKKGDSVVIITTERGVKDISDIVAK